MRTGAAHRRQQESDPGLLEKFETGPRMAEQQESDPGLLEKFESVPEYANYLLTCGKRLYHQEQYEGALQAFMHSVSVMEQPGQTFDADELEWRGAMLHNMASCLHHLAELDAARAYYELAIASFRHAEVHGARPCAQPPHAPPSRSPLHLAAAAVRARRTERDGRARHGQQAAHSVCQPALVRHWPEAAAGQEQLHGQRGNTPPSAHAGGPGGEGGAGGGKARGRGGRVWECSCATAHGAERAAASRR